MSMGIKTGKNDKGDLVHEERTFGRKGIIKCFKVRTGGVPRIKIV